MGLTDVLKPGNEITTVVNFRFTLDGKRVTVLQNFVITGDLNGDLMAKFDGERFDTYAPENGLPGQLGIKTLEKGKEGKHGIISYHRMSEKAAENGGRIVVKNITVDAEGHPTFNLITLLEEKE